jgi:putative SOS response-associated peptidase YedK
MDRVATTAYKTGPAIAPGEPGCVIRRAADGVEMVNLAWGLAPNAADHSAITVLRSEGRRFPDRRCLVPASEFFHAHRGRQYRFTRTDGDWFYFAGVWRPAASGWPAAYAVLTIPANPDVAPHHPRQMAVIRRADRMAWLDDPSADDRLLRPLPRGTFAAALDVLAVGFQPQLAL